MRAGVPVLIVEAIALRAQVAVARVAGRRAPAGARADEWRFTAALPPMLRDIAKGAGLDPRELTARSIYRPPSTTDAPRRAQLRRNASENRGGRRARARAAVRRRGSPHGPSADRRGPPSPRQATYRARRRGSGVRPVSAIRCTITRSGSAGCATPSRIAGRWVSSALPWYPRAIARPVWQIDTRNHAGQPSLGVDNRIQALHVDPERGPQRLYPIVDAEGRLTGVVTRVDLQRLVSDRARVRRMRWRPSSGDPRRWRIPPSRCG